MPKIHIKIDLNDDDCYFLSIKDKLPDYEQLVDFLGSNKAAYIHVIEDEKERIYYFNKIEKTCIPIEIGKTKLETLKKSIQIPTFKTRRLSPEELVKISQLTGHHHFCLAPHEVEQLQILLEKYPYKQVFKEDVSYSVLNKEVKLSHALVKQDKNFYVVDYLIDNEETEYTMSVYAKVMVQNGKIKIERCDKTVKISNWYEPASKIDLIRKYKNVWSVWLEILIFFGKIKNDKKKEPLINREAEAIRLTGIKCEKPIITELSEEPRINRPLKTGFLIHDSVAGKPLTTSHFCATTTNTEVHDFSKITLEKKMALLIQLCFQLNALHQKKLLHGDLTRENILYDADKNSVQLINFGCSLPNERPRGDAGLRAGKGGDFFRAPEEGYVGNRTIQGDTYSLAGIFLEILGAKNVLSLKNKDNKKFDYSPFSESYDALQQPYDFTDLLTGYDLSSATENEINKIKTLLHTMSDNDPKKRPDLNEVIQQLREVKQQLVSETKSDEEVKNSVTESPSSDKSTSVESTSLDIKRIKKIQIALGNAKTDPVMQKFAAPMTQRVEQWQQHHNGHKYRLELTYNEYPADEKIQKNKIYLYKNARCLEYAVRESETKVKRIRIYKKQLGAAFENIGAVVADLESRKKLSYGEEQAIFRLTAKQGYHPTPLSTEDLKQFDDKTTNVDSILKKRLVLAEYLLQKIDKNELLTAEGTKRVLEQKLHLQKDKVDLIVDLLSPDKVGLFEEIASKLITAPCKNLPNPLLIKLDFEHENTKFKTIVNETDISFKASVPIHFIGNGYTKIIGKANIGFSVNKKSGEVTLLPAHINFDLLATRGLFDEKNITKELKEKYGRENIRFGGITENEETVQNKIDKTKAKIANLIPKAAQDNKQLESVGLSSKTIDIEAAYLTQLQQKLTKHFKKLVKSAHDGSRTLAQVESDINGLDKFINNIPVIQNHITQNNETNALSFDKEGYKKNLLDYAKIEKEWKSKLLPKMPIALDIIGKIIFLFGGTMATLAGLAILVFSILLFIPSVGLSFITEFLGAATIFTGVAGIWIGLGLGAGGMFKVIENSIGFFYLDKFPILAEKLASYLELNSSISNSQKSIISQLETQPVTKNEVPKDESIINSENQLAQKDEQSTEVVEKRPSSPKSEIETTLTHTSSDSENEQKEDTSIIVEEPSLLVMGK